MDYKNAKIYTVRSHLSNAVYVGSTCSPLHKRFHSHKVPSRKTSCRQIIDLGDAYIELYEEFPCDNIQQLRKREGEVIRSMDCVNKNMPGRAFKESEAAYKEKYPERVAEKYAKYYQNNKERVSQKNAAHYQKNKEKILMQKRLARTGE